MNENKIINFEERKEQKQFEVMEKALKKKNAVKRSEVRMCSTCEKCMQMTSWPNPYCEDCTALLKKHQNTLTFYPDFVEALQDIMQREDLSPEDIYDMAYLVDLEESGEV